MSIKKKNHEDQTSTINPKKPKIDRSFDFMTGRDLTLEEINLILPNAGYQIYNLQKYDILNISELQKIGNLNELESNFFSKIYHTNNLSEKTVLINLLNLLKGDRTKKKKAEKKLKKQNEFNIVIEKIVLLFITQKISLKDKERLIRILDEILKIYSQCLYREVLYCLIILLKNEELKSNIFEIINLYFLKDFDQIFEFIKYDLKSENKEVQDIIAKILAISVIYYEYNTVKIRLTENNLYFKNDKSIQIFIKAHFYILGLVNDHVTDFIEEMVKFLDYFFQNGNRYLKIEIANLISHLCIKKIFNDIQAKKLFDLIFNNILIFFSDNIEYIKVSRTHQESSYIFHLLRSLSFLSLHNQYSSIEVFKILKKIDIFDLNCIKIFYNIFENLDFKTVLNYILENLTNFLDTKFSEYKKMISSIFLKILPEKTLEDKLILSMIIKTKMNTTLEIFKRYKQQLVDSEKYKENCFLLIKNNNDYLIRNLKNFIDISNPSDLDYYKLLEIGKNKIRGTDKKIKILGLYIIRKIINKIDIVDLKKIGEILYESLDKTNDEILIVQLSLLSKIYSIVRFKNFSDLVLDLSTILKIKNDKVKEKTIIFITNILKFNKNTQHEISKSEFIRICYDVLDYLSFWYLKSKQCAYDLLIQISEYIAPQEIINIFTDFLVNNNKKVKKGLIIGISRLSDHVGFYNIFPILLVDYKYVDEKIKLVIVKTITKCKISSLYLPFIIPIYEDCILNSSIEFRLYGIKLFNEIIKKIDKLDVDTKIIIHLLNITWYNILENNLLITKEFNLLIENIINLFGIEFIIKYIVIGLFHPAKKIRKRYKEILKIVQKYGEVERYIENLTNEIKK